MKRIANNVAVETIICTMYGKQMIRVYDRQSAWDDHPAMVFEGSADELYSCRYAKITSSKVCKLEVEEDGVLCFTIETIHDEY